MTKYLYIIILIILAVGLIHGCSDDKGTDLIIDQLALSPSSLSFNSLVTALPTHPQRTIWVSIDGVGTSDWTVEEDADWIEIGPAGTDTIFVTIRSENLSAGLFIDTIIVRVPDAANSPQRLIVTLEVADWITTMPDSLEFNSLSGGDNPDSQWVEVISLGGSAATYSATAGASWMNLSSSSGDLPDSIKIQVDISGQPGGTYRDSIVFLSPELGNSRTSVQVVSRVSSWTPQSLGPAGPATNLEGVSFANANVGYISGWRGSNQDPRGLIYKSTDGGANWTASLNISNVQAGRIFALSENLVWVAADSGRLLQTVNGGDQWTLREDLPLDSTQTLIQVTFSGLRYGWAVGALGAVVHSSDSGNTWTTQNVSTTFSLNDIVMINSLEGWLCGDHGNIYHTTNGGMTWTKQTTNTLTDLKAMSVVDHNHAWAVGSGGLLLATVNGGTAWTVQDPGTTEQLRAVYFVSSTRGWAAGREGIIIRTVDGGQSWQQQLSGTSNTLFDQVFVDDQTGWTIGEMGTVLKTTSGGF